MSIFTRKKEATSSFSVEDIRDARDYVGSIHQDLRISAEQQQQAVNRIAGLTKTIEKMEVGLSALTRLEGEMATLSANHKQVSQDLSQKKAWASELQSKLQNLERQHAEARQQLEAAKSDIAARKDSDIQQKEDLKILKRDVTEISAKLSERDTQIANLKGTIERLQDDLHTQSIELSQKTRESVEFQKSNDALVTKLEARGKKGDMAMVELKALRVEHADLKTKYFETHTAFENARYDLKAQKTVFEDTLKRREDENLTLKTQIDQMNTQVRIKENMSTHMDQEIVSLRNSLEAERERLELTERRMREKATEADLNAQALERAKSEYERLNEKFSTALDDIETLRAMTIAQQEKLDRYAAVSGSYTPNLETPAPNGTTGKTPDLSSPKTAIRKAG